MNGGRTWQNKAHPCCKQHPARTTAAPPASATTPKRKVSKTLPGLVRKESPRSRQKAKATVPALGNNQLSEEGRPQPGSARSPAGQPLPLPWIPAHLGGTHSPRTASEPMPDLSALLPVTSTGARSCMRKARLPKFSLAGEPHGLFGVFSPLSTEFWVDVPHFPPQRRNRLRASQGGTRMAWTRLLTQVRPPRPWQKSRPTPGQDSLSNFQSQVLGFPEGQVPSMEATAVFLFSLFSKLQV